MKITPTRIPDVKIVTPVRRGDERGHFVEVFSRAALLGGGIDMSVVQENQSLSRQAGTVRGLHFQCAPVPQGKLVRVVAGRIWDVAIDIRPGSPTFGQWVAEELSAADGRQIFIPRGFAHGFCTLEPETEIAYLVDNPYTPDCDRGIRWNDSDLAIDWPPIAGAVVSNKDSKAPSLSRIAQDLAF